MTHLIFAAHVIAAAMRRLALLLFAALALGLSIATGLATAGVWPWIELAVTWNGAPVANAGMLAQIGLTVLAVGLCFFLPTNVRVMQLENSHRKFSIAVDDITRAYHAAHHADRNGTFNLGDAFESTKERLAFLRDHPDLGKLEPELLELAAKMSHISRDLAESYSDIKVDRARSFLQQRQFEIDQFNDRLNEAKAIQGEFSTWINRLDLEENVARSQLERLLDEFERLLPEMNIPTSSTKVTQLPTMRAE